MLICATLNEHWQDWQQFVLEEQTQHVFLGQTAFQILKQKQSAIMDWTMYRYQLDTDPPTSPISSQADIQLVTTAISGVKYWMPIRSNGLRKTVVYRAKTVIISATR